MIRRCRSEVSLRAIYPHIYPYWESENRQHPGFSLRDCQWQLIFPDLALRTRYSEVRLGHCDPGLWCENLLLVFRMHRDRFRHRLELGVFVGQNITDRRWCGSRPGEECGSSLTARWYEIAAAVNELRRWGCFVPVRRCVRQARTRCSESDSGCEVFPGLKRNRDSYSESTCKCRSSCYSKYIRRPPRLGATSY